MEKYNTFWPRFFAMWIDGIVLNIVGAILTIFLKSDSSVLSFTYLMITTTIPYLYAILMIGEYGQTLGKMAMGIKVVDHITEEKIGFHQAFLREAIPMFLVALAITATAVVGDVDDENFELSTLGYIILYIPTSMLAVWSILEIITMLFDEKNRALHDKIAGTVVVKT